MVRVVRVPIAQPITDSVDPQIRFDLELSLDPFEAQINVEGELVSPDGTRRIGYLREFISPASQPAPPPQQLKAELDSIRRPQPQNRTVPLVALLSPVSLNYLETLREQNPKRDLELKLRLQLSIMRSKASVLPVDRKGTNTFPDHDLIATPRDPSRWSSHSSNQWVLSGDTAATFIEISTQRFEGNETAVRIPAEDWRYDFAPVLGIGKFMVAELPVLDMASGTFSGADAERVKGAVVALQEMRMELYQGEWNDVIVKARPIAELLRNSIVSDLLKKMNYPPDAIEAFCKSIEGAFDFGSKNIHRTDRSGQLRVPVPADKEDAYLVYSLTVGLMNLLTQKLRKAR